MQTPTVSNVDAGPIGKISRRLLPLLALGYGIAYIDRVNISFAALQMNADLHFSAEVYGLGAGLFSLGYCLLEIPSNLVLVRVGARRWISRIMVTWGLLAIGMLLVRTPAQFYVMRLLLGVAEAGFFPGVLFYLRQWYPPQYTARAISRFYIAVPLGAACMGGISGALLSLHGSSSLAGWQWLFLIEGLPAVVLGLVIFFCLPDSPAQAGWLDDTDRSWLKSRLLDAALPAPRYWSTQLRTVLSMPLVWQLGCCNFLILGANYAFAFSAPAVLKAGTQWDAQRVGWFMSANGLIGRPRHACQRLAFGPCCRTAPTRGYPARADGGYAVDYCRSSFRGRAATRLTDSITWVCMRCRLLSGRSRVLRFAAPMQPLASRPLAPSASSVDSWGLTCGVLPGNTPAISCWGHLCVGTCLLLAAVFVLRIRHPR